MIIEFYRMLWGFLRVKFFGDGQEKLLSLCAENGITLWKTRLVCDGLETNISIKDFRFLRTVRPKGVSVHILKKRGLPFVIHRYRRRSGILVGAVLFFVLLNLLSSYIWVIDIEGNNKVSDREILWACESIGIKEGIPSKGLYPKAEREKLLLKLDGIAWAAINIEGSRLSVNVTETKEKDNEKSYSNLKATADGVIERLDIVSGTAVVKVGDAVKKGDLLVSGIVETQNGTRFVNSKGSVYARIQYPITLQRGLKEKITLPTGEKLKKRVLSIFGTEIPLYLGETKGSFKASAKEYPLRLFGNSLPICIYEKCFSFTNSKTVNRSFEEACLLLDNDFKNEIEDLENLSVVTKDFSESEDNVILKAQVEQRKNIAFEDILLINTGNSGEDVIE